MFSIVRELTFFYRPQKSSNGLIGIHILYEYIYILYIFICILCAFYIKIIYFVFCILYSKALLVKIVFHNGYQHRLFTFLIGNQWHILESMEGLHEEDLLASFGYIVKPFTCIKALFCFQVPNTTSFLFRNNMASTNVKFHILIWLYICYRNNFEIAIEIHFQNESYHYKRKGCFKWVFIYSPKDKNISNDLLRRF